jgi:hypothetical protein
VQQHSVRAPAHDAALTAAHRDSSSVSSPVRSDSKQVSAVPPSAAAQHASRNSSSNSSNSICVSAGDDWRAIVKAALHSDSDLESACSVLTTCEQQQQQQHSTRQRHTPLTAVDLLISSSA